VKSGFDGPFAGGRALALQLLHFDAVELLEEDKEDVEDDDEVQHDEEDDEDDEDEVEVRRCGGT
jgi:hypothetical protein